MIRVKLDFDKINKGENYDWISALKSEQDKRGFVEILNSNNCYKVNWFENDSYTAYIDKDWIKEYCDNRIFVNQTDFRQYGTKDDMYLCKCPKCNRNLLKGVYSELLITGDDVLNEMPEMEIKIVLEKCEKCNELYIFNQ